MFLVRSSRPSPALAEALEEAIAGSVRVQRFRMALSVLASGAGLLLVGVGVWGLVAMAVAGRRRELGIRATLGAVPHALSRMVVAEHLRSVGVGALAGLLASWWTTRLVSKFLYRIDAHDPCVWSAAKIMLLLVATLAAWLPARQAGRVDPVQVLRAE